MRVLITGGAGFIGTHLLTDLLLHGHDVATLDREPRDLIHRRVDFCADLLGSVSRRSDGSGGRAEWRSMPTSRTLDHAIAARRPDVVVHLAAQVGRQFGEDAPAVAALDNVGMTALVARSCAEAGVRLVYASTSEVYGDVGERVAHEDAGGEKDWHTALAGLYDDLPHNVYGLTKRQAEEVAVMYATQHGVPLRSIPASGRQAEGWLRGGGGLQVIRPSMPFGPGLPPGRGRAAIVNFLWLAHHGAPLVVHRGAERSWCWVGDCVAGIRRVIEAGEVAYTHDQWRSGVGCYNVGRDDAAVSMHVVARMAVAITGKLDGEPLETADDLRAVSAKADESIELVDPPGRQTIVKRLSTAKLRGLGWEPTVDLEEGMRRTYAHLVAHNWQGAGAP